jgi:hypothetical protein
MQAKAQQGIHEVIFSRYGVKMFLYQLHLFLCWHFLITKVRNFIVRCLIIWILGIAIICHAGVGIAGFISYIVLGCVFLN